MRSRHHIADTRRGLTAFSLLGLAALALLVLSGLGQLTPVQDAVGAVAAPVQRGLVSVASGARSAASRLASLGSDEQAEIARLRAEVDRLTAQNVQLQQLRRENDQLREQLGFTSAHPELPLLNARVIGRDPASIRQYLVIDRGAAQGVQPGMAIVHPGGALVGQVLRVERNRSEVLLITDVESGIAAKVQDTHADGIIEGRWQKGYLLEMRYIQQGLTADGKPRVAPGKWVVSSGLGGRIPDGILIGRVESVEQRDTELEQRARVLPAVDIRSVESVLVVRTPQP